MITFLRSPTEASPGAEDLALAVQPRADFFCTTDYRLLKKAKGLETRSTKLVTPHELVMEVQACA